ncbi:MAG TPA: aminoglycoside phosphotransferase family protein [Longimicrobium sp.]|nr:aminoglycoside phosphotransferase family protein [Longimicrobium sp.]
MAAVLERMETNVLPEAVLAAAAAAAPGNRPVWVETFSQDSNDRAEARFADGRTLVVKRARHAWARERFAASRAATRLLREAGIPAPEPLPVPKPADALPVEAYWKIELPTLADVWAGAGRVERGRLLRGWGALLRRIHAIRLPAHGALLAPHRDGLADYLRSDLCDRLLPAMVHTWPQATAVVETLADAAEGVAARLVGTPVVLVHNDLHSANVLCDAHARDCVGALDLEAAFAGPAEADIAHVEVLHGPLFGKPLPDGWSDKLHRGYGQRLDPQAIGFFRAFHLLNLGYHAAFCGHAAHAADVLAAAETEMRAFRRSRRTLRSIRISRPSSVQVCGGGTSPVHTCAIPSHRHGRPATVGSAGGAVRKARAGAANTPENPPFGMVSGPRAGASRPAF